MKNAIRKKGFGGAGEADAALLSFASGQHLEAAGADVAVALAIGSVQGQVSVDIERDGTTTFAPRDLFRLKFSSPKVGLDENQMTTFRQNLAAMFDSRVGICILNEIPANADLRISSVRDLLREWLAGGAGTPATRTRGARSAKNEHRQKTVLAVAASTAGMALGGAKQIAWDKPLRGGRSGLKNPADIARLKGNLARLAPEAADWIRAAPLSPENTLSAVADFLNAAGRRTTAPRQTATYAIPAIVVTSDLTAARARVANILGRDFAAKASERFVCRAGWRMKISPSLDIAVEPTALVLEFDDGHEQWREPLAAADSPGAEVRAGKIAGLRSLFYSNVSAIRADLAKVVAPAPDSEEAPLHALEVCWLNGTVRVVAKPRDVANCAGQPSVLRIGMPRLLEREMDVSVAAIGAIAFRQANPFSGPAIQVAVIDGECDALHPALAGRIVHRSNLTAEPWGSPDPHATSVAGILCSSDSVLGGVCPAVSILNYKVFTTRTGLQGTDFGATQAMQGAVEDGARVINLSWGLGLATEGNSREARAVNRAWQLGAVVVKSAGNKGPTPGTLTSPADAADVIVVGATNRDGTAIEPYSSRGPAGRRRGPDLLAPGADAGLPLRGLIPGTGTGPVGSGTSFATPHVAGLAALLIQQNPSRQPDEVRALLAAKCSQVANASTDAQGHGFVKI